MEFIDIDYDLDLKIKYNAIGFLEFYKYFPSRFVKFTQFYLCLEILISVSCYLHL